MALALHHVFEILQFAASKPSTAREVRGIATHAYKSSLRQFTLFSGLVSRAALACIEDSTYKGHNLSGALAADEAELRQIYRGVKHR